MRFKRPCLDCGLLSEGNRCSTHQAQQDKIRNLRRAPKKANLYNAEHRRRAKEVRETATYCHLCGKPFLPGERIEADHIYPGESNSPLAAAHRACNQRRGDTPIEQWRKDNPL